MRNQYTQAVLHIPVATEFDQAVSILDSFKKYLGDMFVVYTKEDEALRNGLIASLAVARKVVSGFVTNGQQIPEDLVRLKTNETLVNILFNRKYDNV